MSGTGPGRFDDTLLLQGLPADLWQLLARAAAPARLALVGGAVRDLLLHREHRDPWRGLMDLDLVVDADASGLSASPAEQLLATLKGSRALQVRSAIPHGRFGTVAIELQVSGQELLLDLASARQERYPQPAANPSVRFGRLEEDLARRDFSINAMALVLDPEGGEPQLLDPHGGRDDLQRRQLRVLHADSFRDDPTRTLRAARYAARLGFRLAPASLDQLQRTLAAWPWPWRAGDPPDQAPPALSTRLRMELELLLEREPWPEALAALQAWGGLALLDARVQYDRAWRRRLSWARRFALSPLAALVAGAADPLALAERLQIPHHQHKLLAQWLSLRQRLAAGSALPQLPSAWCALLEAPGCSAAAVALALACGDGPRRPLLRWWLQWRHVGAPCGAAELMAREGLQPGPALGERLRQLRAERLDQLPSAQ